MLALARAIVGLLPADDAEKCFLARRGKIKLDYDWERLEEEKLSCQKLREALPEGRR
jgi:hypothetical protein